MHSSVSDVGRRSFLLGGASVHAMAAMSRPRAGQSGQAREPEVEIALRAMEDVVSILPGPIRSPCANVTGNASSFPAARVLR